MKPRSVAAAVLVVTVLLLSSSAVGAVGPVVSPASQQAVWGVPGARFRTGFVLSNPSSTSFVNASVVFYIQFPWGEVVNANNMSVQLRDSNQNFVNFTVLWQTVQDGFVVGAVVVAQVTIGSDSQGTFFAYYGDPTVVPANSTLSAPSSAPGAPAKFTGMDVNYTFLSTFDIGQKFYLSLPVGAREGSATLGAAPFDSIIQPWRLTKFTNGSTIVASAVANDSGLIDVRTLVGTNSTFWLTDVLINERGNALGPTSLVYYTDLSHMGTAAGSVTQYDPLTGVLSVTAGEASLQMSSDPTPSLVDLGQTSTVLAQARTGALSLSESASGGVGMASEYTVTKLAPYSTYQVQTEWGLLGAGSPLPTIPLLAGYTGQESVNSGVPGFFGAYQTSLTLKQTALSALLNGGKSIGYTIKTNETSLGGPDLGFVGQVTYSLPGFEDANFTSPTAWKPITASTTYATAVASTKYYSPIEGAYTGLVSVSGAGFGKAQSNSPAGSATLQTSLLGVYGPDSVKLHLTYLASSTVADPTNQTSLYFAVGIDSYMNGTVQKTLLFPVDGLAPSSGNAVVAGALQGDGTWHQVTVDLGSYVPSHNFGATLVLNATSTAGDSGSLELQVTDAYLQVVAQSSSLLAASVQPSGHFKDNHFGSIYIASPASHFEVLTPVTLKVPFWESGSATTTAGDVFDVSVPSPDFGSPLANSSSTESLGILIFDANATLLTSTINGTTVLPVTTTGGYVLYHGEQGPMNATLSFSYNPFSVLVENANGAPMSAAVQLTDLYSRSLLTTTGVSSGLSLRLLNGTYVVTATFGGAVVASQTVAVNDSGRLTLHASVFAVGFYLSDVLGNPIAGAQISLRSLGTNYSATGITDGLGRAYFDLAAGNQYSVTASFGGSVLATQAVTANTDGAVISLPTSYTPLWIPVTLIVVVLAVFVLAVYIPRIARRYQKSGHDRTSP